MPPQCGSGGRRTVEADDGMLAPGFVDLQVNGGGGVMLNDHPDVEASAPSARAHAPFGTTALLPTLITDTPEITAAAVAAGVEAARAQACRASSACISKGRISRSPARARTTRR